MGRGRISRRHVAAEGLGHPLLRKLALEVGPLAVFFLGFLWQGIFMATGLFMAAVGLASGLSFVASGRLPVLPMVSMVLVIGFGAATLIWNDPLFVMIRPTVANLFFAAVIGASLMSGEPLLKRMFTPELEMPDAAWTAITLRVTAFLAGLALLNEVTWRNLGLEAWVMFKVFAVVPLNVVFGISQMWWIRRKRGRSSARAV